MYIFVKKNIAILYKYQLDHQVDRVHLHPH